MRVATRLGLSLFVLASIGLGAAHFIPTHSIKGDAQPSQALKGPSAKRFDRQFAGVAMPDADGLAGPNGKARVVNLWATWCAPCRAELPALDRMQVKLGSDVPVIAIAEDQDPAKANAMLDNLKITHVIRRTDTSAGLMWAVKAEGLPVTLILDGEGHEIARVSGALEWDNPAVIANVRALTGAR